MTPDDLLGLRMSNQSLSRVHEGGPADVVRSLGALQGQDYPGALWSIGLRLKGLNQVDVEQAVREHTIVRTWPMRGTLHFVTREDARWMVQVLAPRVASRHAVRLRKMGLERDVLERGRRIVTDILAGGEGLTRREVYLGLERGGVPVSDGRGLQVLWWLAHQGLVCLGAHSGKQPTFVLLDSVTSKTKETHPADPLSELAERYFSSHGPATLKDLAWWSGLKAAEIANAVQPLDLEKSELGGAEYWSLQRRRKSRRPPGAQLLPVFDEYIIAYKDRSLLIDPRYAGVRVRGLPVLFVPKIVFGGRVVGTWRRSVRKDHVEVALSFFAKPDSGQAEAVERAAEAYGAFLGRDVVTSVTTAD